MREVLANRSHPRHKIYTAIGGELNIQGDTTLQTLAGPDRWVPDEIYQVTADLYDIYLVKITMQNNAPYVAHQVDSRGCRNARHMFLMLSNEFHYEPMRPIVKRPSEFQYPELSSSSLNVEPRRIEKHVRDEGGDPLIGNSYRKHRAEELVPEQLIPRPTIPLPSEADIANTISGLRPPRGGFSTVPGWMPSIPAKADNGSKEGRLPRKLHKATEYARLTIEQAQHNRAIYETFTDDKLRAFCNRRGIMINPFRDGWQTMIDDLLGDDALWKGRERVEDPLVDTLRAPPGPGPGPLPEPRRSAPPRLASPRPTSPRLASPRPASPRPASNSPKLAPLTFDAYMQRARDQLYDELKMRDYTGKTGNKLYKLTKKVQLATALVNLDQREGGKREEQGAAMSGEAAGQRRRRSDEDEDRQDKQWAGKRPKKK
jgi:hypothetical protein